MKNEISVQTYATEIGLSSLDIQIDEQLYFDSCNSVADLACPILNVAWNRLLENGRSPEKIYQMPAFVRSRNQAPKLEKHWDVIIVRRRSNAEILGILPLREGKQDIRFQLGPVCLFKYRIAVLQLLGSVPLLTPNDERLFNIVMKRLFQQYPHCHAISMQAVPVEVIKEFQNVQHVSSHIMSGWRECHTVPLPDSVGDYLKKFSSKKRYNLSRQIRLLSQEVGEVKLIRITEPEQVSILTTAMHSVPSARNHATPALQAELTYSAGHGLLLSYLLQCGDETVALIIGSAGKDVWHVHNIFSNDKYLNMSVGTSVAHLALQDVIENQSFKFADFGYGTPNQDYRSTNVLKRRAQVLLCKTISTINIMLGIHNSFRILNDAFIETIKLIKKMYFSLIRNSKQYWKDVWL